MRIAVKSEGPNLVTNYTYFEVYQTIIISTLHRIRTFARITTFLRLLGTKKVPDPAPLLNTLMS